MVTVHIKHWFSFGDFCKLSGFEKFKSNRSDIVDKVRSNNSREWTSKYDNSSAFLINVLFIGQTGVGKSSTINSIIGGDYMETSAYSSCTKEMNCVNFQLSETAYLSFCDMPGIGENPKSDQQYYEWYSDMFELSDCVVYMLSADKRDFGIDIEEFKWLYQHNRGKVFVGLNYVDKIEPINRYGTYPPLELTYSQQMNLDRRINEISQIFEIEAYKIIPFSAVAKYNLDILKNMISSTLVSQILL